MDGASLVDGRVFNRDEEMKIGKIEYLGDTPLSPGSLVEPTWRGEIQVIFKGILGR